MRKSIETLKIRHTFFLNACLKHLGFLVQKFHNITIAKVIDTSNTTTTLQDKLKSFVDVVVVVVVVVFVDDE